MSQPSARDTVVPSAHRAWLLALLAFTVALGLVWSQRKLIDQDEMFVLQTDSVATFADLVRVQLHWPISLDPLLYHSLVHLCGRVVGFGALALRLPSIAGFLLMQLCLYRFVRRTGAPASAGLLAAAFPLITASSSFVADGRPYGLLLGLCGLILVAYQESSRRLDEDRERTASLIALAAGLALALNAHYFAVLLLLPVYAAETARTFLRRRVDLPIVSAIVVGTLGELATLPFQRSAKEFKLHYYNVDQVSLHAITQAYRAMIVDYTDQPMLTQRICAVVILLAAFAFVVSLIRSWKRLALPAGESVLLVVLALLPCFGFLLARFVTHSIEVRYVLCALVAITVLLALLLGANAHRNVFILLGLVVVMVWSNAIRLRNQKSNADGVLARLPLPAQVRAELAADPSERLYIQDMGPFDTAQYYVADPMVRSRITLVYSAPLEIEISHHDTQALTAEHMTHFTTLPIVRYESLRNTRQPLLIALYPGGWDFTREALRRDGATVTLIGRWNDGTLVHAQFP